MSETAGHELIDKEERAFGIHLHVRVLAISRSTMRHERPGQDFEPATG